MLTASEEEYWLAPSGRHRGGRTTSHHLDTQVRQRCKPNAGLLLNNRLLLRKAPRTALVYGDSDLICLASHAHRFKDAIPGAKLMVITEAGHMAPNEKPDQVVATMARRD